MSDKRTYNILFHTHTVSGIVISVALYVIFFTGSFSFFRDEIVNWERNHTVEPTETIQLDFDTALDSLDASLNLYGRDLELSKHYVERTIGVSLSKSKDTLANPETNTSKYLTLDSKNYAQKSYEENYTLGEFLYRLHFFAQIFYPYGYYLAGFVAFFFLFAIITGVLVHWNKIVSNFYTFRPLAKLKTMWTDAHTTLGIIGLPFQFVYAVTGAFFMIKAILIAPNVMFLYNNDSATFYKDLGYAHPEFEYTNSPITTDFSVNTYIKKTEALWPDFDITQVHVFNYGDENMHVLTEGHLKYKNKFTSPGETIYKVSTGELVHQKNPYEKTTYLDAVKNVFYRIHYGDYGGFALRIVSFVLGIISCFVIISGVMIWLVARDKKNVPEKKRRFNEKVVRIYLAICLSMYPITALSFIAVKVWAPVSQSFIYNFYFIGWLLFIVAYILKKDNNFTNKNTLLLGSIFGFLVPVANGICTGNWFWKTFLNQQLQLCFIDIFWIILASTTLFVYFRIRKK
ncbi:PepSY-associated TM helix domain-containing protein [Formosa haliotis]|uniref:PepSY-associated TM helix domain-containing protein n=1 Tax=Formosa haliotis TaxID=1555194 RepID=UPI0008240CC9|nr:PepSY-associated TM helix domain-containing protein [Formosa haliotis]